MTKQQKAALARPAPISLHPLTTEQALGALLLTPQPSAATLRPAKQKPKKKKRTNKKSRS